MVIRGGGAEVEGSQKTANEAYILRIRLILSLQAGLKWLFTVLLWCFCMNSSRGINLKEKHLYVLGRPELSDVIFT